MQVPELGRLGGEFGTLPLPSVYWNHRVSVKSADDLWGSMSYRQNIPE